MGFLSGLGSFAQSGSDNDRARVTRSRGRKVLNTIRQNNRSLYDQAQGQLNQRLGTIKTGFGAARRSLGGYGDSARQGALTRGAQTLGAVTSNAVSAGSFNTTAFANAQRGIASDTTRSLAEIDLGLGQILAQLDVGEAESVAGAQGDLANFSINRAANEQNVETMWFNLLTGQGANDVRTRGLNRGALYQGAEDSIYDAASIFLGLV